MKKLVSLFALLACMATAYAQNALVATLNHNDTIKVYYGANALKDAHSAAVNGDVITLSSGTFLATDITKGITLRGAGAWADTVAKRMPTVISGDFKIGKLGTSLNIGNLIIEGIFHNHTITVHGTVTNGKFLKSRIKTVDCDYYSNDKGHFSNTIFIHCHITNYIDLYTSDVQFYNSIINRTDLNESSSSYASFTNCILYYSSQNNSSPAAIKNATFNNSILYQKSTVTIDNSCMAYNCVNPNKSTTDRLLFKNISNNTNTYTTSEVLFKTYRSGDFTNDSETFELTDSAKTTFLGTDGTQVGIYGGDFPFDPTVSVPQITKFEVAKQSTADGKLNVNIEVNAAAIEPKK